MIKFIKTAHRTASTSSPLPTVCRPHIPPPLSFSSINASNVLSNKRKAAALLSKFQQLTMGEKPQVDEWRSLVADAYDALPTLSCSQAVDVLYKIHQMNQSDDEEIIFSFLCYIFNQNPVKLLNATNTHRLLRVITRNKRLVRRQWKQWLADGLRDGIMKQRPEYISLLLSDMALMPSYTFNHVVDAAADSIKRNTHLLCYRTAVFLLNSFGRLEYKDDELYNILWEYIHSHSLNEKTPLDMLALTLRGLVHAEVYPSMMYLNDAFKYIKSNLKSIPTKYISWICESFTFYGYLDESILLISHLLTHHLTHLEINDLLSCLLLYERHLLSNKNHKTIPKKLVYIHSRIASKVIEFCYHRIYEVHPPYRVYLLDMVSHSLLFNPYPPMHLYRPPVGYANKLNCYSNHSFVHTLSHQLCMHEESVTHHHDCHTIVKCFIYSIYFRVAALNAKCLVVLLNALLHLNVFQKIRCEQPDELSTKLNTCSYRNFLRIILREMYRKLEELSPESLMCCISQIIEADAILMYPQLTVKAIERLQKFREEKRVDDKSFECTVKLLRDEQKLHGGAFPYQMMFDVLQTK